MRRLLILLSMASPGSLQGPFETGKISYKEVLHRSNEVKTGTGAGSYMSILSELNSLLDGLGIPPLKPGYLAVYRQMSTLSLLR